MQQPDPHSRRSRADGAPVHRPGERRTIEVAGLRIGPGQLVLMAGPCAVESREQLLGTATAVAAAGGHVLRGGAYKPRTSPASFQGLGEAGLGLLAEAREATGLPVVTELLDPRDADAVAAVADIIQIGARSMHLAHLLDAAGRTGRAVLVKRNPGASVAEWLAAADYVLATGNDRVLLCERGIRTFETSTRYTLDLGGVVAARELTDLPIIVDPSHAAGRAELVPDLARAAVAAGADGLLMEVHPTPESALSDGRQSLPLDELGPLARDLADLAAVVGRSWGTHPAEAIA